MDFPKGYVPKDHEDKIYKLWEESGFFNPDNLPPRPDTLNPKPYCITLPPPNVTGTLHMGHAAMLAIEDVLIRFERMRGKKTLWVPGTDHAAIATQEKVERDLYKKEKKTRQDLGRDKFLKLVDKFARTSHDTIVHQLKKMGASLDWSREAFTLDEPQNLAVKTAFKSMYDAGLIYRGHRIVNWDPKLQTTVSDDEIEWIEQETPFYYFKYGPFTIGTARPETKFGDKYVVMHPSDVHYKEYKHGQKIDLEWINGPITATVIKDEIIDPEFGSGVMTITPWHDMTDFDIAERHDLDKEQIIDSKSKLLAIAGEFEGMHIKKARPLIVEKLEKKGLVERIDESYANRIAVNSRGGGIIEPQIKEQWFVDVKKKFKFSPPAGGSNIKDISSGSKTSLKEIMQAVVKSGQIKILPERFEKTYFNWIDNLRDWCISRQIWYGHRVPVWYCGGIEKSRQHKIGFHPRTVPELIDKGKRRTYRLRDYKLSTGDEFVFEDSGTRILLGRGVITNVVKTTVEQIELPDEKHSGKYRTTAELIEAFKRMHPEKTVTKNTSAMIYDYEFHPLKRDCGQVIVSIDEPKKCPACGGKTFEQDPDTLDTWFSSGLWTFSTLGWPEETKDLKEFHPTDVLETGYDIIFFWVARMILMTGFLLGDIPFHTVYLHGLVRDEKGRKMSKSLNNTIDPLDMIEKFGADATRLSLIVGAAPGNDVKLSENKVKGYRHFANKVWNAARFVFMNIENYSPKENPSYTKEDKKILRALEDLKKDITSDIENFRLYLAAEKLYHYFWHMFADKIIESAKLRLSSDDPSDKHAAQALLTTILTECLKMLHPFVPFVTETIWQQLPKNIRGKRKTPLMIEEW